MICDRIYYTCKINCIVKKLAKDIVIKCCSVFSVLIFKCFPRESQYGTRKSVCPIGYPAGDTDVSRIGVEPNNGWDRKCASLEGMASGWVAAFGGSVRNDLAWLVMERIDS